MASRQTSGNSQPAWLLPFVLTVVGVICVLPLLRLATVGAVSAVRGGAWALFAEPGTWHALINSLSTATIGMMLSVAIGGIYALALTLTDMRGKGLISFCLMLPTMIPPQVTALSWVSMSGPSSPLLKALGLAPPLGSPQPLYSIGGIALLLGMQHAPLVFLTLRAGLMALPRDAVDAARMSGASPGQVLRDIVLPLSTPGLIAGAAIAFVSGIGNFGIAAILGLPASILTLPTLIYSRFASFGTGTFGDIAMLSGLIAVIAMAGLVVQERALKGRDYRIIALSGQVAAFPLGRLRRPIEAALWFGLIGMLFAPLLALVAASLVPAYGVVLSLKTVTFAAYGEILLRQAVTRTAFANSLFLATVSALGLLVVTVLAAYTLERMGGRWRTLLAAAIEIPYALPGIVVAVAYILLLAAPLPVVGIRLYGTIWIIVIAYFSSFFAVSLKPVASALRQLDPSLEEAARLSGAGFARRMRDIVLPLLAPAAGASVILVFLIACNELTVSALLWSAGTQTLGVAIFNLDDSGSYNLASALSVLVVGMVVVLMLLLECLAARLPRGVLPWRN
ncbi:ABC transporter permease [Rhizobium halophytocola]|uniref:Iron(III) transport system permease protein n=1 Tax=Rhizobium halophytocola TaxID=735519 RepID=A0ABS4DZ14_9HYPH|nr:iron ABC transporter permease [Rhizobium halophytocola]MBP1850923.1 iron(III) transport system permease protein [Rhizobium halophytocola]